MLINGNDRIFYIKIGSEFLPVGCLTSDSFSENVEMLDTTTRDNAGWKTSLPTLQSYNLNVDGLVVNTTSTGDRTKISLDRLQDLKRNRTLVEWKSDYIFQAFFNSGFAYITEISDTSSVDEFITFSASLEGYGKPTLTTFSFKFNVETTVVDETFTIPTESGNVYNYTAVTSEETLTNQTGDAVLTFPTAGTHEIEIIGVFPKIFFNNTGDKDKITSVNEWGSYGIGNTNQTFAFWGCSNLISIADDCNNINLTINGRDMFRGCGLNSLPLTLSFEALLLGDGMFEDCNLSTLPELMTLPVLYSGSGMFKNNALTSLNDGMLLNSIVNAIEMFSGNLFTSLPSLMTLDTLRNGQTMFFDVPLTALPNEMMLFNLINGAGMFNGCSLTALPSGMTLNNLLSGAQMFASNLFTSLPTSMTLENLIDGIFMFQNVPLLALPNVMILNNLSTAREMFGGTSLIDLPTGMTLRSLTNGFDMFIGVTINTSRYSQLLVDFKDFNPFNNVFFHGGNSQYNTIGQTARNILTSAPRDWTITDGGLA